MSSMVYNIEKTFDDNSDSKTIIFDITKFELLSFSIFSSIRENPI